uniref:Immunoglobulin V-set domain-containing protein n=1 Tax=Pundamilia nyererei TaxID=303518 RepID=A0A3B4FB83_9CICH
CCYEPNLLLSCCYLVAVFCCNSPLTLQCPYPSQHRDNRKFLCKGDHRNSCRDMVTSKSRFALQGGIYSNSFSVTITKLEEADAGTYWCGSDSQWRVGNYTKIQLKNGQSYELLLFKHNYSCYSKSLGGECTSHQNDPKCKNSYGCVHQ